jgi:ABC-type transport system involved in multi-copper enzyme maturation permease subunit
MPTLVSAEMLRLRTLRSPAFVGAGALAILLLLTIVPVLTAGNTAPTATELEDGLRSLQVMAVLLAAAFAASTVAGEYKRGAAALTYLAQPRRERVLAGRMTVYAALGGLFGAFAAACTSGVGLLVVHGQGLAIDLTGQEVAGLIAGAAVASALMSAIAVVVGTAARNPTIASGAIVVWNLGESMLHAAGAGPYLPFGLVNTLLGVQPDHARGPAIALLAAYAAVLALAVRRWALPRDLT